MRHRVRDRPCAHDQRFCRLHPLSFRLVERPQRHQPSYSLHGRSFRREEVGLYQAPHVFRRDLLSAVVERCQAEGWEEQSTLQLVLLAGYDVAVVEGETFGI